MKGSNINLVSNDNTKFTVKWDVIRNSDAVSLAVENAGGITKDLILNQDEINSKQLRWMIDSCTLVEDKKKTQDDLKAYFSTFNGSLAKCV